MTQPRPDYGVDPYYGEDSTSTAQFPNPAQWAGEDEAWAGIAREGGKMGAQMLNPWETVKGVGHMAVGAANDLYSTDGLVGLGKPISYSPVVPPPSLVGDLGNLAKGLYNNPWGTVADMATAPGSIPGFFAPGLPKIPKGGLYRTLRDKPGRAQLRKEMDGLGIFEYDATGFPDHASKHPTMVRPPKDRIDQLDNAQKQNLARDKAIEAEVKAELANPDLSYKERAQIKEANKWLVGPPRGPTKLKTRTDIGLDAIDAVKKSWGADKPRIHAAGDQSPVAGGHFDRANSSVVIPKRGTGPNPANWRRHEFIHPRYKDKHSKVWLDNYMNELTSNIGGAKSVTQGLKDWSAFMHNYPNHGSPLAAAATSLLGDGLAGSRKAANAAKPYAPIGPVFNSQRKEEPNKPPVFFPYRP